MMMKHQFLLLLTLLQSLAVLSAAAHGHSHSAGHSSHYHDTDGDGTDELHDSAYDQDQFLGKDMAKKFAEYDSAVSEEKLTDLVQSEIDSNKDGFVTEDELVQRLEKVNHQQQGDDIDVHWRDLSLAEGGKLNWSTYAKTMQPNFFDQRTDPVAKAASDAVELAAKGAEVIAIPYPEKGTEDEREPLMEFFKELVRQRKRWAAADADADGLLTREEYRSLLFPEDVPAMREVLLAETMDQLDKDRDGRLSQAEYLAGQWTPSEPSEKEPHWVAEEREGFKKKDANGDGFMDRAEVEAWLQPPGIQPGVSIKEEAKHLMREADDDRDGRLSLAELVKHREVFAGSKATRYGEDIMTSSEPRDEL